MTAKSQPKDVFKKFRVTPSCWVWEGSTTPAGYGKLEYQGKMWLAHRLVYSIYEELPKGILRHRCDNKWCVNPNHLLPGTHADNAKDAMERGLNPSGEKHGMAKYTLKEINQIRDLIKCGLFSQVKIAEMYGVKVSLVYDIKGNRCWSNHG